MMKPTILVATLTSLGLVSGHGWMKSLIAESKTYTAYLPLASPDFSLDAPSIVRKQNLKQAAETDLNSSGFACTRNAVPIADNGVSRTGQVTAGTTIKWQYNGWPHNGPIMQYMARCDPDCGKFVGNEGAVWFKTEEAGYSNGTWWTERWNAANWWWTTTVPKCLEPGEYLVRLEIINLSACPNHKCEFYPECFQIKVVGNGTVRPSANLVAFPGAYDYTMPGLDWDGNVDKPADYVIPGPPVFKCPA